MHKVKIVGITKPEVEGIETADEFIAYCARVSNPSNQLNVETAPKLVSYLMRNKHWSPFEMVNVCMEIQTTRDIARQILRHRSFAFQEFSQRYADPTINLGFVLKEARLQDNKNRQNSVETTDIALQEQWKTLQERIVRVVEDSYDWAIQHGIAKEQARALLPEGLTVSKMYMNGTLRSWYHYCDLRMSNGTQKEHRDVAKDCWKHIVNRFPTLDGIINNE